MNLASVPLDALSIGRNSIAKCYVLISESYEAVLEKYDVTRPTKRIVAVYSLEASRGLAYWEPGLILEGAATQSKTQGKECPGRGIGRKERRVEGKEGEEE